MMQVQWVDHRTPTELTAGVSKSDLLGSLSAPSLAVLGVGVGLDSGLAAEMMERP